MTRLHQAAVLVAAACLAGCAVGPDYHKPEMPVSASWKIDPSWRQATPSDAALKGNWWEIFENDELNALETAALRQSQTLAIANARLQQARESVDAASAGLFPQLGASFGASRGRTSANRPLASYGTPPSSVVQNNFTPALTVQYESDLFGRVRREIEGARATAEEARANFENTRLMLTSDIAAAYFNLRELDVEIDVVRQSVESQKRALDFVTTRHDLGASSGLDVAQQQAQLDSTTTQIEILRNQRAHFEHMLAVLVGVLPSELTIAPALEPMKTPSIPVAIPSLVLQRRPDIASAERAMASANAQIGVARAAFFPNIPLTASYGTQSAAVSNLFSAPSVIWSFGVTATQTLFDAGAIRANVRIAEEGYTAAVASYRQSVLISMQEVEDGIAALALLDRAAVKARAASGSASRALEIANDRYSGGLTSYLDVVSAQQLALTNQRQEAQIVGQQMIASVSLVKALGGGWQDSNTNVSEPVAPASAAVAAH